MASFEKETETLKDVILTGAKANMLRDSHLMPVFFIVSGKGEFTIVGAPVDVNDKKTKVLLAAKIKEIAKERDARLLAFVFEAWSIDIGETSGPIPKGDFGKDPRRQEVIYALMEARGKKRNLWMANVHRKEERDEDSPVTSIDEWQDMTEKMTGASGIFIGLLPQLE